VNVSDNSLSNSFSTLLDSIGFAQNVNKATHSHKHTLDLVLTYGIEISDLIVFPQNPILSDHFLITFQFILKDYPAPQDKVIMKRTISEKSISKFKEIIEPIFSDMSCDPTENSFSPSLSDQFVDLTMNSLKSALDVAAPLKHKVIWPKRASPWYNEELRSHKQTVRKLEKQFRRSHTEESLKAWKICLLSYKQSLCEAQTRLLFKSNRSQQK